MTCQTNSTDGTTYDDEDGQGCSAVDEADAADLRNGNYSDTVYGDMDLMNQAWGMMSSGGGYIYSSDPDKGRIQQLAQGISKRTSPLLNLGNKLAGDAVCAYLAGGAAIQSFLGIPFGNGGSLQNKPPGTSSVLRAPRAGATYNPEAVSIAVGKVAGPIAAKFAEDAIPVAGEVLLGAQAVVAGNDAVKFFHQCNPSHP